LNELVQEKNWLGEKGLWLVFLVYFLVALASFNRGILLTDEGYQVIFAWLISRGEKIYKDYYLHVFPLSFLLQAILVKLFGFKLILFKIYSVLFGIAGFFSISYISRKIAPEKFWLISSSLYIFFSNNLFNFTLFSIESKLLLILSLCFGIAGLDSRKPAHWFGAGFFAAMAGFEYQTLFAIALVELILLCVFLRKKNWRELFPPLIAFLSGFLLVSLAILIYLLHARLLQETLQVLFSYTWAKKHVWRQLVHLIFPLLLVNVLLIIAVKKLWQGKRASRVFALVILFSALSALIYFWFKFPKLLPHSLSLLVPTSLFSLSGIYLFDESRDSRLWLVFIISILLFLTGLFSGYNLGYNLTASILLIPWTGFLVQRWQKASRAKFFGLSPAGLALTVFMFSAFIYMFIFRTELDGEVEPIYQSRFALNLKTARGIYTSREKKAEMETLVKIIQERTRPDEKIFVFPNHTMLYPLSEREPIPRAIYFFYEIVELKNLEQAVADALDSRAVVVFQLQNGKIFQPVASKKADELIKKLSESCQEKILLKNYMVCEL